MAGMSDEQPMDGMRGPDGPEPLARNAIGTILAVLGVLVLAGAIGALLLARWAEQKRYQKVVDCMRAYAEAQVIYHRADWDGNETWKYAYPFTLLATQKDAAGAPIRLIEDDFAAAAGENGRPLCGYLFKDVKTVGGCPIDSRDAFAFCATPARYGRRCRYTFIIGTNGTTFRKDLGRSRFLEDYPAYETRAGWEIVE